MKQAMKITRRNLKEWGATDERIERMMPRCGLTPLEVARRDDVSAEDRLWVLLRECVLHANDLYLLAAAWTERSLVDRQSWDAIRRVQLYAMGASSDEGLPGARSAAWEAAWEAAWASAETAAVEAWRAWAASWQKRDPAASCQTSPTAWKEAWKVAEEAALEVELADVVKVLAGKETALQVSTKRVQTMNWIDKEEKR